MASTSTYKCFCGNNFIARTADRKRGWARYCSKSCKAIRQESRTGQYAAMKSRNATSEFDIYDVDYNGGWDEHKNDF